MKKKLEELGITPSEIIESLMMQGCKFDGCTTKRGCIMQQWFRKQGTTHRHVYTAISYYKPMNKMVLEEVTRINDAVVGATKKKKRGSK